jgi:hypothetical protein
MAYNAIVTRLKNVRPHPNADRVQLATCHGNQVVVGLDSLEDHWGVYFPSDGQLSHEFCHANNLYRDVSMNANPDDKPGMFDPNRRVRAQRFRGEISDGFWVPLHYFGFIQVTGLDVEGFEFDNWKGVAICNKYVNQATLKIARENQGKKTKTAKKSIMFKEHFDTAHFGRNIHEFKKGQTIIVTEKLHGTSGRIGHVQLERDLTFVDKVAKFFGAKIQENEWKYLNGTRRVVIEESKGNQFHDPTIRDKAFKLFEGNLRKGETVFFEIVGYESTGATIMPSVDTTKMGDKAFTKFYGDKMTYSYGCNPLESAIYVYRMTFTNEDGQTIDYSWDDVVKRSNEIGVKHVPVVTRMTLEELELATILHAKGRKAKSLDDRDLKDKFSALIEQMGSGPSVLDTRHIKEGVCVRIEGGIDNKTFKFKSFEFKLLEGIVKDSGVIDAEEAEAEA